MFNWLKKKEKESYEDYEEVFSEKECPEEEYSDELSSTDVVCVDADNIEFDPDNFGERTLMVVDNSLKVLNSVSSSVKECVVASKMVEAEIARMNSDLDKFIIQSDSSLTKFKGALPILDRQLNKVSDRIDKITDQMLGNSMDPTSAQSIQKHQMMMDMLTKASDSFNDLLAKLINL